MFYAKVRCFVVARIKRCQILRGALPATLRYGQVTEDSLQYLQRRA